jgi:serine/threonine-protein kinase HipA
MFELTERGLGVFTYRDEYLKDSAGVALDPVHLPAGPRSRPMKELKQDGLFGVIRDAKPEGYGLDVLASMRQVDGTDHMRVLELSEGDTVGAIAVCDDIEPRLAYKPPQSEELLTLLASLPETRPSSDAVRQVHGFQGTSAGGERPKLTVFHEGQHWLAKLQDRGDRPHAPLREYVAMRVAAQCGVHTADVQFRRVGDREVVLVRRFDREVAADGSVTRSLYASAHTVLHLDKPTRGSRERSYVALSKELQRWCATREQPDVSEQQRQLLRRIVLNCVLGNGDDHPRNTGLIFDGSAWRLSPAFDIAPYGSFTRVLSMDISRAGDGAGLATTRNIAQAARDYGYIANEAIEFIQGVRAKAPELWRGEVAAQGFTDDDLPFIEPVWMDAPAPQAPAGRR